MSCFYFKVQKEFFNRLKCYQTMKIVYHLNGKQYSFSKTDDLDNSTLLTTPNGNYWFSALSSSNLIKQGFFSYNPLNNGFYKTIHYIELQNVTLKEIHIYPEKIVKISTQIQDNFEKTIQEEFFLGPSGGAFYQVNGYKGLVKLYLDPSFFNKKDDSVDLDVKNENTIVFYSKTNQIEKEFFGLFSNESPSEPQTELVMGELEKKRNDPKQKKIMQTVEFNSKDYLKIIVGVGTTKKEIVNQITLLSKELETLQSYVRELEEAIPEKYTELTKLLPEKVHLTSSLAQSSLYHYLNKNIEKDFYSPMHYGFPYKPKFSVFTQILSLTSFIDLGEEEYVKNTLFYYLHQISKTTGKIMFQGCEQQLDCTLWLFKQCEEFIFSLNHQSRLHQVLSKEELKEISKTLESVLSLIIKKYWNFDLEELVYDKVETFMKKEDSLYFYSLLASTFSTGAIFEKLIENTQLEEHYLEIEVLLRERIRELFFRDGMLYSNKNNNSISFEVFLTHYLYPELLLEHDWEKVFDKALLETLSEWGGISTTSKYSKLHKNHCSGYDEISKYHGDVLHWLSCIAGIELLKINKKKYSSIVSKILSNLHAELTTQGTLGYLSECSCYSHFSSKEHTAFSLSSVYYLKLLHYFY
jgi:hypothetical protein